MSARMEPTPAARAASDPHAHRHATLARAVRATGGVTLLSRFGGLVRDVVVGRIFGDTAVGSAFAAAFAIPNMFRRLFGEGALSAAFIPAYARTREEGRGGADGLASLTLAVLGAVTVGLTVVIEIALLLVLLLMPHNAERALSIRLIMLMLPFMPLICCVAILAGVLQVHGRFGPAASGPLILNAFIIAVGAWCLLTGSLADERVAYLLGIATVLSGVTQLLWFLRLLRPHVRWTRSWGAARARGRAMLRKFVPVAIGLGTLQLSTLLDTLIAMWPIWVGASLLGRAYPLDEASNIILSLTQRLYQFPLGVFGIAVATAAFPLLARHANEPEHFVDTIRRALRLSLFIGVPASVGLVLVRHEAVGVMFGYGRTGWSPQSLDRAAGVLAGYACGVWAYSLNQVWTRAFYARQDTATPMKVSLGMIGLNLGLNLSLIWVLREAGLAWGTAIAAILQTVVLGALARRMLGQGLFDGHFWRAAGGIVVASVVMGLCVWGLMRAVPAGSGWVWQVVRLVAACGTGGVAYLILARVLGLTELAWMFHVERGGSAGTEDAVGPD